KSKYARNLAHGPLSALRATFPVRGDSWGLVQQLDVNRRKRRCWMYSGFSTRLNVEGGDEDAVALCRP
ncbi:hypothetical protein, partial [Mitsuokella sp. AF21-1AC]|uniref:hypothetical protein n=1 Tax=Mitsuokella sp. AF21-1AC TaxID=2292235 RepID=UPI001F3E944B